MLPSTEELSFQLKRSRRRTLAIEIDHHANVIVRAPTWVPSGEIQRFVRDRRDWVEQKIAEAHARRSIIPQRTAQNQLYFRGALVSWGWHDAEVILPKAVTASDAPHWLEQWQRRQAHQIFQAMIDEELPRLGVAALRYNGLRLRKMRRRWGSCTRTGHITLNEHLIRTPDACIRGVVIHELCHLVHLNHGTGFYALLTDLYPEHRLTDTILGGWTSVIDAEF